MQIGTIIISYEHASPFSDLSYDAVAVVQLHIERIHKKDYPNGISRTDALKEIKEA